MSAKFIGTCVELSSRALDAYDDTARDITYRTFRSHVGRRVTAEINAWAGWPGTHFSKDYHIRYSRGKWKGQPAVCMMHSSIHYIWKIQT